MLLIHNETQKKIFTILVERFHEGASQPSFREIMDLLGIKSPNTIRYHIRALAGKGFIEFQAGRARSIRVLKGAGIPVFREGSSIHTLDRPMSQEEELPFVARSFGYGPSELIAIRVGPRPDIGNSILAQDLVIIRKQSDCVKDKVALVSLGGHLSLTLANSHAETLLGVMIGLVRLG